MKHADPYLTAKQLGVEPWIRDGLVALLPRIERGEIDVCMTKVHCGTVACIGGHLALMHGIPPFKFVREYQRGTALGRLFFPLKSESFVSGMRRVPDLPREQIVAGLRNYLTTGEPDWPSVTRGEAY